MPGNTVIGLIAHVDAGKTTLAESLLFSCGKLGKTGRVDHGDAFLDTHMLEKKRGITIFSKQAQLEAYGRNITLLDTPGHEDLLKETERAIAVLDYAVFIISASDGVNSYSAALWSLLEDRGVPLFIFINKTDLPCRGKEDLLSELKENFGGGCTDFTAQSTSVSQELATCSEDAMAEYLEKGSVSDDTVRSLILKRQAFPCFFASALKQTGIDEFLAALCRYTAVPVYPETFGARVFKIARDSRGERLTYLKVTGGTLKVKSEIPEKINQIRFYDGAKYKLGSEAFAGTVCAVTGPVNTHAGDGLGADPGMPKHEQMPLYKFQLLLPPATDLHKMLVKLKELEEEEPQLGVSLNDEHDSIYLNVRGNVQLEIIKNLIYERSGVNTDFIPYTEPEFEDECGEQESGISGGAEEFEDAAANRRSDREKDSCSSGDDLKEIFERTYGKGTFAGTVGYPLFNAARQKNDTAADSVYSFTPDSYILKERCLIVDGYNIIFAWDELKGLAEKTISGARDRLADILSSYQGYTGVRLILVFDGYKVKGNPGETLIHDNITIVYTKESESADQYIERLVPELIKSLAVSVATSDRLEQISVFSHGAVRISADELRRQIDDAAEDLRSKYLGKTPGLGKDSFKTQ